MCGRAERALFAVMVMSALCLGHAVAQAAQSATPEASQSQSDSGTASEAKPDAGPGGKTSAKSHTSHKEQGKAGQAASPAPPTTSQDKTPAAPDAPASDKNKFAFPEELSRKAAAEAAGDSPAPDAPTTNAPAHASSGHSGGDAGSRSQVPGGYGQGNGLPRSPRPAKGPVDGLSRRDAATGHQNSADADSSDSSSSSSSRSATSGLALEDAGSNGDANGELYDPYRAQKDDQVADFYKKSGNDRAAYLRYQDALRFKQDDAVAHFGLAELAQKEGKDSEAVEHYRAYLKLEPDGNKVKQAERALTQLHATATPEK